MVERGSSIGRAAPWPEWVLFLIVIACVMAGFAAFFQAGRESVRGQALGSAAPIMVGGILFSGYPAPVCSADGKDWLARRTATGFVCFMADAPK